MAKAYKDLAFLTSKILNNETHLFCLSGLTTYSRTTSYLDKVTALTANTDGIINGLVMVFANPAPIIDPTKLAPGHAHLLAIKILHRDRFLAPIKIVPRHCASTHFVTFVTP